MTVGTIRHDFSRLLIKIDKLIESKKIKIPVISQIGYSSYIPQNHIHHRFVNRRLHSVLIQNAKKIITHGGSSSIWQSLRSGNPTIIVPRLEKYDEHINDHQLFLSKKMKEYGFCDYTKDFEDLAVLIDNAAKSDKDFNTFESASLEKLRMDLVND